MLRCNRIKGVYELTKFLCGSVKLLTNAVKVVIKFTRSELLKFRNGRKLVCLLSEDKCFVLNALYGLFVGVGSRSPAEVDRSYVGEDSEVMFWA